MKKTVVITGATSGIGYALAEKFAQEKYFLVLISSNEKKLSHTMQRLQQKYPQCIVKTYCHDLSAENEALFVYSDIRSLKRPIDVFINNAGFGLIGSALSHEINKEVEMLYLNVIGFTQLTEWILAEMYKQRFGKILNVASMGAFQPGPYTASYYASKAYVSSYSRAIRREAAKHNVEVCTLYPGATRTNFFKKAGKSTPPYAMSPKKVAYCAYNGLMKNQEIIIPGAENKLVRLLPEQLRIWGISQMKHSSYNH